MSSVKSLKFVSIAVVFLVSGHVSASEPSYCEPSKFLSMEINNRPSVNEGTSKKEKLERLRAFQVGSVRLAGMGVGFSDGNDRIKLFHQLAVPESLGGQVFSDPKNCTWYTSNKKDVGAVTHWLPLDRPDSNPKKAVEHFGGRLNNFLDQGIEEMIQCASANHYVALGCDGMRHRGPTVFGIILAYSGCSPEHAADIVNSVWELNGINPESRLAVIRLGSAYAKKHPEFSQELRRLFEGVK